MLEFVSSPYVLAFVLYAGIIGSWAYDFADKRRRKAREKAASVRIVELRRRLWDGTEVGAVQDAAIGVLIARADRAERAARAAERVAVAALTAGKGGGPVSGPDLVVGQADYAIDADAELDRLLSRLRKALPPAAREDLEASQAAFRDYRDAHVRLCRDSRDGGDRMEVRHYASEAVTRARILDLEDLEAAARLRG